MHGSVQQRALLVGSLNPAKVNAARVAVDRCFPHQYILAQGVNVASGVRDQPVGDDETLLGAVNRVKAMATTWQQHYQQQQQQQQQLQSAASELLYQCTPDSLLLAVEGGVLQRGSEDLYCFAWAAAQLAGGGKISTARSAEFLLPRQLSELVLGGMELGAADDTVFGRTQSGQGNGTVGKLTDNIVTRAAYYEHAIVMALIPFMNLKLYPEFGLATEESCHVLPLATAGPGMTAHHSLLRQHYATKSCFSSIV